MGYELGPPKRKEAPKSDEEVWTPVEGKPYHFISNKGKRKYCPPDPKLPVPWVYVGQPFDWVDVS